MTGRNFPQREDQPSASSLSDNLSIAAPSGASASQSFPNRKPFILGSYIERQEAINGILAKNSSDPTAAVKELNQMIRKWGDVSYNYFSGQSLRGLDISDTEAQYSVFSLADLRGIDARGADLRASIGSGANLANGQFDGADLTHGVYPLVNFEGASFIGSKAVSAVFNLIQALGAKTNGLNIMGAYLLGAQDFSGEGLTSAAGVRLILDAARKAEVETSKQGKTKDSIGSALAAKFDTAHLGSPRIVPANMFTGINQPNMLSASVSHPGTYIADMNGPGADLTDSNFLASIFNRVNLRGASMTGVYLGGLVSLNSDLGNMNTDGGLLWLPGAVINGGAIGGTQPDNIAGAVFNGTLARNLKTDSPDLTSSGAVFIGDEKNRPEIKGTRLEDEVVVFEDIRQLPSKHNRKALEHHIPKTLRQIDDLTLRQLESRRLAELEAGE